MIDINVANDMIRLETVQSKIVWLSRQITALKTEIAEQKKLRYEIESNLIEAKFFCWECRGQGKVEKYDDRNESYIDDCDVCKGSGKWVSDGV